VLSAVAAFWLLALVVTSTLFLVVVTTQGVARVVRRRASRRVAVDIPAQTRRSGVRGPQVQHRSMV
jgi:hypothetical protein